MKVVLALCCVVSACALDIGDFAGTYTVNTPETITYLKRESEAPANTDKQHKLYGLMVRKMTADKPSDATYTITTTDIAAQTQDRTERFVFGDITADGNTVSVVITLKQGEIQRVARLVFESVGKDKVLMKNFEGDVDVPLVLSRKTK